MSNITKSVVSLYYAYFTHNPQNEQVVFHRTNLPPTYASYMHNGGANASGYNYSVYNYATYHTDVFGDRYDTFYASDIAGTTVSAAAVRNAVKAWSLKSTLQRRVTTGVHVNLNKGDHHTPPGSPFNGIGGHRADLSKVSAAYRAFDPRQWVGDQIGSVSYNTLANYLTTLRGVTDLSGDPGYNIDLVACHNSCHSACHGSRGRR